MTTSPPEPEEGPGTADDAASAHEPVTPGPAPDEHGRGDSPEPADGTPEPADGTPESSDGPDGPRGGAHEPEVLDDDEVDRRFASILAGLGATDGTAAGSAALPPARPAPAPADVPPALGPRDQILEEHPEDPAWGVDGFVEPDPPGPNLSDPGAIVGWLAAIGPLVVGLVLGMIGRPPSVPMMLVGLAVIIGGVVLLVRRLPDERGPGSDGAVV